MKDKYIIWLPIVGWFYGMVKVMKGERSFDDSVTKFSYYATMIWQPLWFIGILTFPLWINLI